METIDTKTLEEAVTLFYRSGPHAQTSAQSAAHEWLTKVQCSRQAWSFVWDLMQLNKSSEIQFFGATTLHAKLLKGWSEVPKENRNELKQKIFESIILFGNGPRVVLNRLCISLSAFVVQMVAEDPSAIDDIINTFQTQQLPNINSNTQFFIMLEVLAGIPEELRTIYASVQRTHIANEISRRSPLVIGIVQQFMISKCDIMWEEDDMVALIKAIKCADSWLNAGGFPLDKCEILTDVLLKLINTCYWASAQSDDGCMTASENELTEMCIKSLTTLLIQPESYRYPNSALQLLNVIVESLANITKAEWKENNLNEDIAFNIYTLFISSIECHSKLLIAGVLAESPQHHSLYMRLIEEIIHCTNKPGIYPVEESCSSLAMGFWYMLQDEILSNENTAEKMKCLELIGPLYSHLTNILVKKAQQPDEASIEKWSTDDLESFRCYRQDISDTLLYCQEVLHDHLLEILTLIMEQCLTSIQADTNNWTPLEACIYAFYSIAEHVDTFETKYIPKFALILSELPYDKLNEKLLGTAIDSIGAYSEWFKENPSYIPSAIRILVFGLNSTQTSQATLGLKDICRECQLQLCPFAEPLLQACQQAIAQGQLKNSECVRLMYSIGKLMSMLSEADVLRWLDTVVSPCFEELSVLVREQNRNDCTIVRTLFRLNMISTLFSSLNINVRTNENDQSTTETSDSIQPVLFIMQKTMPILKNVGTFWIDEHCIIEALCNALRFAITNLLNDFKPMLPDLCNLIITILQSRCVAPAVDIAKTCIILFYKDAQCQQIMRQLLIEVIVYNIHLFEHTSNANFSLISDVIESFYTFNSQITKKLPQAFSDDSVDCVKLIHFAMKAMTLPEVGPVKQAISFLMHFITQSRNHQHMTSAVLKKGEEVIQTVLLCIGIYTLRNNVELFADIFVAFNKKYPAELVTWMKVLEVPNYPTACVTPPQKETFMKSIIKEKVNKRLVQAIIRDFAIVCRNLAPKSNVHAI